jgi:hypothetical protein
MACLYKKSFVALWLKYRFHRSIKAYRGTAWFWCPTFFYYVWMMVILDITGMGSLYYSNVWKSKQSTRKKVTRRNESKIVWYCFEWCIEGGVFLFSIFDYSPWVLIQPPPQFCNQLRYISYMYIWKRNWKDIWNTTQNCDDNNKAPRICHHLGLLNTILQ